MTFLVCHGRLTQAILAICSWLSRPLSPQRATAPQPSREMACPSKKLNSGHDMPMVGLGTWQAAPGEVGAAVRTALEAGYRHIDCAACYGNEKEIGDVLAEMLGDGEGQIPRSDVFITSKLWNSEHAPAHVQPALDQTLAAPR